MINIYLATLPIVHFALNYSHLITVAVIHTLLSRNHHIVLCCFVINAIMYFEWSHVMNIYWYDYIRYDLFRQIKLFIVRRVWRYQRGNQNLYIEEEQTTRWPREKVQKNKQRSTKHTYKTKDRVTWTLLKTGVSSSCSTSGSCHVNLVTNPVDDDKSWMRKGPGSVYDKWNISVVICDTDIP